MRSSLQLSLLDLKNQKKNNVKRRSEPVIKQVANDTLFTEPKIQAPVNPGVVTSVENNTSDDEQILTSSSIVNRHI